MHLRFPVRQDATRVEAASTRLCRDAAASVDGLLKLPVCLTSVTTDRP